MPIALLVPKLAYAEAKRLGAIWDQEERAWFWPDNVPREAVKGWLPRMYKPGMTPPHILPKMIPASMFGVNLRALIPEEWRQLSRDWRANFGNRCQVCGSGLTVECHEDWEYILNCSVSSEHGVQKLRRLVSLCRNCHELKHLGKTEMAGRTRTAMAHLAFVNGWAIERAEQEAEEAWKDWELRNRFSWVLDVSWAEQEFGLIIDAGPERITAIQKSAGKRYAARVRTIESAPEIKIPVPNIRSLPAAPIAPRSAQSHRAMQHQPYRGTRSSSGSDLARVIGAVLIGCFAAGTLITVEQGLSEAIGNQPILAWLVAALLIVIVVATRRKRRLPFLVIIALLLIVLSVYLHGVVRS